MVQVESKEKMKLKLDLEEWIGPSGRQVEGRGESTKSGTRLLGFKQ